jgi:hypothetical protein
MHNPEEVGQHQPPPASQDGARPSAARLAPAPNFDVEGMPVLSELSRYESSALRRVSPRWGRWTEIAELDHAVEELEAEHTALGAQLATAREQLHAPPTLDAEARGTRIANGRAGTEPDSDVPTLEAEVERLEHEIDARRRAIEHRLERKHHHAAKHRARLVKDADKLVEERLDALLQLLPHFTEARDLLAKPAKPRCGHACTRTNSPTEAAA